MQRKQFLNQHSQYSQIRNNDSQQNGAKHPFPSNTQSRPPTPMHPSGRRQQRSMNSPKQFRNYLNKFQVNSGFHSANNSRHQSIQQFQSWKSNSNNFCIETYKSKNPSFLDKKMQQSVNQRLRKNSEIIFPGSYDFEGNNEIRIPGVQPMPVKPSSNSANNSNRNTIAPSDNNFTKLQIAHSMIISSNDFKMNSDTNIKKSVILMNHPKPENLTINKMYSPPSKISQRMNFNPHEGSKQYSSKQKGNQNSEIPLGKNTMKQSSILNRNIEIKNSIIIGEGNPSYFPDNKGQQKNQNSEGLIDKLPFKKSSSRQFLNPVSFEKESNFPVDKLNIPKVNNTNQSNKFLKPPLPRSANNKQYNIQNNDKKFEFRKKGPQSDTIELTKVKSRQSLLQNPTKKKEIRIQDFEIIEKLGKGAFGDVFLAQEKLTKFICVIKSLSKTKIKEQKLEEHVLRQIKIQNYLQHKHLVSLYGVFDDQQKIYLILEPMVDGCLSACKKKISENQTAFIIKQVLEGLAYMHSDKVIHRDIKPQNIFMLEDYIKIGDFGCAVYSEGMRKTVVGCLAYISPQQLNQNGYDVKIDIWSVGVLTYELLFGRSPFEADLMKMAKIQYQNRLTNDSEGTNLSGHQFPQLKFPQNRSFSEQTQQFIKNLLSPLPDDRMDVRQALRHKFIKRSWEWQQELESKVKQI